MAVRLRLKRIGMTKQPYYRLVAVDRRTARGGSEIEILGHYDPSHKQNNVTLKSERIQYWLSCGALPTETVQSLLVRAGFFKKK
ncbi:MAG: 30S ribosomal protein S16 [Elusimicrobia bacterium]|nr:30S ribosomal protein S16 [Elusimicrobiota bacterium]MBI3012332.1 30S ribosomal protein S16 [Elusimicrobiota bacterium]